MERLPTEPPSAHPRGALALPEVNSWATGLMRLKSAIRSVPILGPLALGLSRQLRRNKFKNSADYWEQRYRSGRNSGAGSYSRLAEFKAAFLNDFVTRNCISSVIEIGSGDGAQLELANYPSYVGIDVSKAIVEAAKEHFSGDPSKTFFHTSEVPAGVQAELSLSIDVIYHLVEDDAFDSYMRSLFDMSSRYVIIYSSNHDGPASVPHVRHRSFARWIDGNCTHFTLKERVPNAYPFKDEDPENTSFADFYVFERSQPI